MEYLLGSIVTLITMYIVSKMINRPKNDTRLILRFGYNQSRLYDLVKDFVPRQTQPINTQSTKHNQSKYMRVIFINKTAYWIEDSVVYMADYIDGKIDDETKIKVDIMGMDKVELDKMIFIIDRLTEGLTDDSGNSGNKKF